MDIKVSISSKSYLTYSMDGLECIDGKPQQILGLNDDGWKFFEEIACDSATHVAIAMIGKMVIGWFRFSFDRKQSHLCAQGTWVDEKYRRVGIAESLWEKAITSTKPSRISVITASPEGRFLVNKMELRFVEEILFRIS